MNTSKKIGLVCFAISTFAIIAMFITANSIKSSSWSAIDWITKHFWYGYHWFIIGAALFAIIGCLLLFANNMENLKDFFVDYIWDNDIVMILVSAVILILACIFLFPSNKLMFIVFLVLSEVVAFLVAGVFSLDLGKRIFYATLIALIFSTLLCLICGIELYPDNGYCGICGGDGMFQGKICKNCGGWGTSD